MTSTADAFDMAGEPAGQLSGVEETLFIPLVARARESSRKRPLLRDPKAAEIIRSTGLDTARYSRGAGGAFFVLRTAILDTWVLRRHRPPPHGRGIGPG
jgi:O-methyltransferase involved in polyketide biosynthesis